MNGQLYRIPELLRLLGLSRSTLFRMVKRGDFPRPLQIGLRAVGWRVDEVQQWIAERPRAGRSQ